MLSFLPRFDEHLEMLQEKPKLEEDDTKVAINHLSFFLALLRKEYARKLETLASLLTSSPPQITFDYVWGLFVPGTLLLTHCGRTGEPLAVRLISCNLVRGYSTYWSLRCENVDVSDGAPGFADYMVSIQEFSGAEDVIDLSAFPMSYLDAERHDELCASMTARGKRHWELAQHWCHKDYDAIAHADRRMAVCSFDALSTLALTRALYCR